MTPPASPSNSRDRRHPNVQVEAEPLVDSHRRAGESPATSASTRARMRARRARFGDLLSRRSERRARNARPITRVPEPRRATLTPGAGRVFVSRLSSDRGWRPMSRRGPRTRGRFAGRHGARSGGGSWPSGPGPDKTLADRDWCNVQSMASSGESTWYDHQDHQATRAAAKASSSNPWVVRVMWTAPRRCELRVSLAARTTRPSPCSVTIQGVLHPLEQTLLLHAEQCEEPRPAVK